MEFDPNPNRNTKMKITIYTSESGTHSKNVAESDASSHIAAGCAYSTESEVLLAFIECDEVPFSLEDGDGDIWVLRSQGVKANEDFFCYELQDEKQKMNTFEINKNQQIPDPSMADSGRYYFSTYEYRVDGDVDLYGTNEWRSGKIIWSTTDAWKDEEERVKNEQSENPYAEIDYGFLGDESMACDWSDYELQDEDGATIPENAEKQVAELLP